MKKKLRSCALLLLSSLLLTGCTTTITNLTPSTHKRNPAGLYPFEVALDTSEACIKKPTLTPYVQVGSELYPMQPTLGLKGRWETLIPVTGEKEYLSYRYKFIYNYRSLGEPKPESILSRPFQLQILDR